MLIKQVMLFRLIVCACIPSVMTNNFEFSFGVKGLGLVVSSRPPLVRSSLAQHFQTTARHSRLLPLHRLHLSVLPDSSRQGLALRFGATFESLRGSVKFRNISLFNRCLSMSDYHNSSNVLFIHYLHTNLIVLISVCSRWQ